MRFSGHETFICRQFWLKKGYDFLISGNSFGDDNAVIVLGVGKNMVAAIGYWMKAFGLCNERWELSEIAHFIFGENGRDQYLEDIGTVWLFQYFLVKQNFANIYNIFFNNYRRDRIDFTLVQLHKFIELIARDDNSYNFNTLSSDLSVFLRMYLKPTNNDEISEPEDTYSGIFNELQLISKSRIEKSGQKGLIDLFRIPNEERKNLPAEILLFSILDRYSNETSISFKELEVGHNSPATIFALNRDGLHSKIEIITKKYKDIIFSSNSGVQILQIKSPLNKWNVLIDYYANN